MKQITHFVDGKIVSAPGARRGPVFNPATGEQIAEVELAPAAFVAMAIESADRASREWGALTPIARARILFNYKGLMNKHADELAALISEEHGKTLADARGEVTRGIEVVEFACGVPQLLKGEYSGAVGTGVDSYNLRHPLGVCAGITPFNFPAMVPLWMFPVALACGNSFILKPSEKDPSCPIRLAELAFIAGVPRGVLNVVNGDKEAVDVLLTDSRIQAVSFVGSTPIAEHIFQSGSAHNKRVQALGGAKNHLVVMPDAEVSRTTDAIIGSAFGSAGERCMAVSIAVCVGPQTADKIRDALVRRSEKLKVGPATDATTDYGPVNTKEQLKRIHAYIESGVAEGAELVMDGRSLKLQGYENGYFIGPCIFDGVKSTMKIYQEEIFGPVLGLVRVECYAEALSLVNDHPFGNGATIFTNNGGIAQHFVANAKIGMVGVNVPIPVPVAYHSFGGWKRSLFGDHHMHGPEGIRFYTRLKTATTMWLSGSEVGPEFSLPTLS